MRDKEQEYIHSLSLKWDQERGVCEMGVYVIKEYPLK